MMFIKFNQVDMVEDEEVKEMSHHHSPDKAIITFYGIDYKNSFSVANTVYPGL